MIRLGWFTLAACVVVGLLGCGGGSGSGRVPPPDNSGEVRGRITGVADPTGYALAVDGQPVAAKPSATGDFRIPGLPPGPHTIGCVGPGGLHGAYVAAQVRAGRTVTVDDIRPDLGGQIAGIITRWLEDGSLEPVADVEVVAMRGDPLMMAQQTGSAPGEEPLPVGRHLGARDQIVISAFTDAGGSYVMKAVPPGAYDLSVVVPGHEPLLQFVWVEPGSTAVADFTLYPAPEQGVGTVEGTVRGADVGPLEGAHVMVTTGQPWVVPLRGNVIEALTARALGGGAADPSPGMAQPGDTGDPDAPIVRPPWIEVQVFSTLTDSRGQYSLNVPIGAHTIECWMEGWAWAGGEIVVERDQIVTRDFRLNEWDDDQPPPPGPGPVPLPSVR